MRKASADIARLFHVPKRFMRSVQLERDFYDPHALDGYIVTPAMTEAFQRIAAGLRQGAGLRAWRITGDYGVGKSSFALVLAHLLRHPQAPAVRRLAETVDWPRGEEAPQVLWPILITGAQENLVGALARGIRDTFSRGLTPKAKGPLAGLVERADAVAQGGGLRALEELIVAIQAAAAAEGAGVLLVVDELGKLLEYAATQPEPEDIFVLQRLAEFAARSGDQPFLFLGLLHQAFAAYSGRLPVSTRMEWEKVAGRFDEIVFDQPLVHTAALVAGALGVHIEDLPPATLRAAQAATDATARMGWLSGGASEAVNLDASRFYPIHPTLLAPLVRFFARFGQHERSLFGFLLSEEPNGLQAFARRPLSECAWYDLAAFYDYVRAAYGHRLAGDSYQNHWLRIAAVVSQTDQLSDLEQRVLKSIAVLNLLDAEDLLPTPSALEAALTPAAPKQVEAAVRNLIDRGLLHSRGAKGGYRLWPNTSVNLHTTLTAAARALPGLESIALHLQPYLSQEPLLARRHYIERGTLRYFEVRYALADALAGAIEKPTGADGLVVVALCDSEFDRTRALEAATLAPFSQRADVVVGVGQPLAGLGAELIDLKRWTWVQDNTPELGHDPYAAEEVSRQIAAARRALSQKLSERSGLRTAKGAMTWFREGAEQAFAGGLVSGLSDVCNALFPKAPRVFNELINRNVLSSAASKARMRVIDGLFKSAQVRALGIDERLAPPERSIYMSVLKAGQMHVEEPDGVWRVTLPAPGDDPLALKPVLDHIMQVIAEARGARVAATHVFAEIKRSPFGVRDGLAPLLLAIVLSARRQDYAIYEQGTFLHQFGPTDFLRLIKGAAAFEIQHCQIEGVRADVFDRLAETFAGGVKGRQAEILDVVTPLCQFAANLPQYTLRAGSLSTVATGVRNALLNAREPASLLFRDLPAACGFAAFDIDQPADPKQASAFVAALRAAVEELKNDYNHLVARVTRHVALALGEDPAKFDRAALAQRAARVALAARDVRLRGLAMQLRDAGLANDSWAENLGSFTLARPPKKWGVGDEARFVEEFGVLADVFAKVEGAAFQSGAERPDPDAVRLNLTRGDGADQILVVNPTVLDEGDRAQLQTLRDRLPSAPGLRLQFLTQLLWDELSRKGAGAAVQSPSEVGQQVRKGS